MEVVAYLNILCSHSHVESFAVNPVDILRGYHPNTSRYHYRYTSLLTYLLLCNPKVHHRDHKIPPVDPITSKLNPVHFTQYFSLIFSA